MNYVYSLSRISEILGSKVDSKGAFDGEITGISGLSEACEGDISFLSSLKFKKDAQNSKASVILVPKEFNSKPAENQILFQVENPSYALALICRDIEISLYSRAPLGVHPSAVIEPGAKISPNASIGAFCFIGAGSDIGACVLENNVSIGRNATIGNETHCFTRVSIGDYCSIGNRNRILAGAVIGSDGYGYEYLDGVHQRVPQIGNVVTGDDVDIGANSTVDRARFKSTIIGDGTKIDNLVQIAHNVRIGKHCLLVAQCGISGSTHLGDGVVVGGQAGIAGHLKIGFGSMIAGGTAVTKSLNDQETVRGYPALPIMLFNRLAVLQRRLPDLFKRFDLLEKSVNSIIQDAGINNLNNEK